MVASASHVRRVLAERLPDVPAASIVPLGAGTDHVAYLVDDRLVVRFASDADAGERVEREARLLTAVGAISPMPVPEPVLVAPDEGCLAYARLPGISLLDAEPAERAAHAAAVGGELGRLLRVLHATPPGRLAGLVERDELELDAWVAEAAETYERVAAAVPAAHRRAIEAFLAAAPPEPPAELVFSHNDLGIEHVLVDARTWKVTGVIDWADAALTDPARDFGLIDRDLGPPALEAALSAYGDAALRDRACFHARCALLEDLAYGLENDDRRYVEKSLAGLEWLFAA